MDYGRFQRLRRPIWEALEERLKATEAAPPDHDDLEALALAYRQVLQLWDQVPGRLKDFVTAPKPNGYQSIHTNVRLADGREIEVQIRTHGMHERATVGSASHEGYRAVQLGGGLSAMDGAVERTSLALRGVQAPRTLVTPPRREAREMELAGARMLPQAQRP